MKIAKHHGRTVAVTIILSMLLQVFGGTIAFAAKDSRYPYIPEDDTTSLTSNSLDAMADLMVSTTYAEYLDLNRHYSDAPEGAEIVINALEDCVNLDKESYDYSEEKLYDFADAKVEVFHDTVEDKDVLFLPQEGAASFEIEVPEGQGGFYTMNVRYFPIPMPAADGSTPYPESGHGSAIERIFLIDGKVPFKEARYLSFYRVWQDDEGGDYDSKERKFKEDVNKNEMRPAKNEVRTWIDIDIYDTETFYDEPLKFYLSEGKHLITFDAASEPMLVDKITFKPIEKVISYNEYRNNIHKGVKAAEGEGVYLHAETPYQTSERVIYAMNDRTSGITEPQDPARSLLNTIGGNGGDKWKNPGQWVSYKFTAPKTGMYQIVPRFKQTVNQGLFSSRSIKINGEYPFEEAKDLQFNYDSNWQVKPLNDGDTEFEFYFEEGVEYTIEFQAVLGDMADILNTIDDCQVRLNDYYKQILMITGTEPDEYTDYEFAKLIPGVLKGMRDEAKLLKQVSADLEAEIGSSGENTVILDRIQFLLETMGNDQDKIAENLSNYKSYIGSLGTWLLSTKSQPLQLDWIQIVPTGSPLPEANAGFFKSVSHELGSFVMSFFTDYDSLGASPVEGEIDPSTELEVWITTGRDQAQIMRQMIDGFNDETVHVNLKLIAAGTLLPATLAGVGPDVSMDGDPVGFGIRNAVIPLNYFDNDLGEGYEDVLTFSEVKKTYFLDNEELFVPLTVLDPDRIVTDKDGNYVKLPNGVVQNGVVTYGLPSTLDFPMLFYRKDIFVELGLEIPQTWDDIEGVIRALSEKQMEMGLSQAMTQIYMYQNGIDWFKSAADYEEGIQKTADDRRYMETIGIESNLDSNGALDAFQRMTEWFTLYGEPVTYDFANRFRTGEMPIAIANYTAYNQLRVFAPEIAGLWEFVQLPGVINEDKTSINHTTPIAPHAMMMMRDAASDIDESKGQTVLDSKKAKNAWKFLQWWVSDSVQGQFGQEQVAIMGTAAKYNTANKNALISQSWTAQEKKNLEQQFASLKGTPMSPGNYIVARYTNFAFYDVVDDGEVPSQALLGYVDDINHELSRKRAEYGFMTAEQYHEEIGR